MESELKQQLYCCSCLVPRGLVEQQRLSWLAGCHHHCVVTAYERSLLNV